MRIKPKMCQCKQCKHAKRYRTWQRHAFAKAFHRISKQKLKDGNFEPINHLKLINYYTD